MRKTKTQIKVERRTKYWISKHSVGGFLQNIFNFLVLLRNKIKK